MDDYIRRDAGIEDEDALGYEVADAGRVLDRAGFHEDETEGGESREIEQAAELRTEQEPSRDGAHKGVSVKKAAGAAGAAVVLAATLGTAAIDTDQATLPDPVPIVQSLDLGSDAPAGDVVDAVDAVDEKRESGWALFLKLLKYIIVLIVAIIALVFALVKGCAGSCAAPILGPDDDQKQEQAEEYSYTYRVDQIQV